MRTDRKLRRPAVPKLFLLLARQCFVATLVVTSVLSVQAQGNVVRPGAVWLDNRGEPIQAHGGGMLVYKGVYYWFGEDRSKSNDADKAYISCYSSVDLVHWKFLHQVFSAAVNGPDKVKIIERPKVFYNAKTKMFVMYMHLDGPGDKPADPKNLASSYVLARVGIAVSKKVDGDYKFVKSFRPLEKESRDIGQFVDDDGSAYLIFESRPTKGFFIGKLSDDYMNVDKMMSFVPAPLEGGALVHYDGLYYVVGSHLSGWKPNPNVYATSSSLAGPWTEFKNIAPSGMKTYGSQSSFLLKVTGTKATTVIFMGDLWKEHSLWDSRYFWMPLQIGGGKMELPAPQPWTLDVKTGEALKVP